MKVFGVVYLIIDLVNGKKYVGQTIQPLEMRFNQHAHSKSALGRSIRQDGIENFRYGVIRSCATHEELNHWEKFFIAKLKTKKPFGYNMTDGGGGTAGWKASPETCARMSALRSGKKRLPFTLEHRAKLSVANLGKSRIKSPYQNLLNELDAHQLSYSSLVNLMEMAMLTVSDKIRGKYNFNERDKSNLIKIFDKPIEYLLQRAD